MDKYCDNCIHRGFEENDTEDKWGFCLCNKVPRGKRIGKLKRKLYYTEGYSGVVLSQISDGCVPSCMLVQSFYKGECPYKE